MLSYVECSSRDLSWSPAPASPGQRVEYYYDHAQVKAVNLDRPLYSFFFSIKKEKRDLSWSTCSPCTKRTNFQFYLFFGSRNYSRDLEYQIRRPFFFLGIWRVPMSLVQLHVSMTPLIVLHIWGLSCTLHEPNGKSSFVANYIKNCTLVYVEIASSSCDKKILNIFLIIKKTFRTSSYCT